MTSWAAVGWVFAQFTKAFCCGVDICVLVILVFVILDGRPSSREACRQDTEYSIGYCGDEASGSPPTFFFCLHNRGKCSFDVYADSRVAHR